uniref:SERPIN domain-containing protein n=1 Tax=Panagrellus redivivus TaxID=6233 RepID=A0A7E4VPI9_PANRE
MTSSNKNAEVKVSMTSVKSGRRRHFFKRRPAQRKPSSKIFGRQKFARSIRRPAIRRKFGLQRPPKVEESQPCEDLMSTASKEDTETPMPTYRDCLQRMSIRTFTYPDGCTLSIKTSTNDPSSPSIKQSQADFALNLIRNISTKGSVILSPVSISTALAMVYLGAKNKTAIQIRDVIAKGASEAEIHQHFAAVLDLVSSNSLDVTLETANRVFIQKNFQLLRNYIDAIKKYYKGELEQVNFSNAPKTAKTINKYVEKATHGLIKDLVSENAINDNTRLILVNAIYFHGVWEKAFKKSRSFEGDFYASPVKTTKKTFMSMQESLPYYESEQYQVLGLPYKNNKVHLYVILPKERYGLDSLIQNLDGDVKLPKFKIDSALDLNGLLQTLGVVDAFVDDVADFSGITDGRGLAVSNVVHKAFIETDENGTEAAAATAVYMNYRSSITSVLVDPLQFIADHGFLFILADADFHMYFAGKVTE